MDTCTQCKKLKPVGEFPKNKRKKKGYDRTCKACKNAKGRISYYKRPPEERREQRRLKRYDITLDELKALPEQCSICGTTEKALHLDHCHDLGHVRAYLCHSCNTGLGKFQDDPQLLEKAAKYVREHRKEKDWQAQEGEKPRREAKRARSDNEGVPDAYAPVPKIAQSAG